MRTFATLVLSTLLAGCATQADRTARMQREVDEMIAPYGPACEKLGFKSDSDPWRDALCASAGWQQQPLASVTAVSSNARRSEAKRP